MGNAEPVGWMPPEWHPHERCFMAWCAAHDLYDPRELAAIHRDQAALARTIARFEPVTMLANAEDAAAVREACGPAIEVQIAPHYDVWTRDTLPTFVLDPKSGTRRAVSWNFNVWGEKFPDDRGYDADRAVAERVASSLSVPVERAGIVAEGGAIETDGEGTLLTTETCLLNPNRNPGLGKAEIEAELRRLTGATQVVWLFGSRADAITDGHVDGFARFAKPGHVLIEVTDDPDDPEYEDLRENERRLRAARDARGRPFTLTRILRPRWDAMPPRGDDFAASYVNGYLANGGFVMARFGDAERDEAARATFARLHPGAEIVTLAVDALCEGGGGIHCNTQPLPAPALPSA